MARTRWIWITMVLAMLAGGLAVRADATSAGPVVFLASPRQTIGTYATFELRLEFPTLTAANPFDPAQIDVGATFWAPDGSTRRAIGFWYQDYSRSLVNGRERLMPVGAPEWRIRVTFDQPGDWSWSVDGHTPAAAASSLVYGVRVVPTARHGYLRTSARDSRYLAFDDGTPYFAVGENLGWYDAAGTFDYDAWLRRLANHGANYARLWMAPWALGIEWNDTGLGDYTGRLDRAWQLDHVLDEARARHVEVMLSLFAHGNLSTIFNSDWADNPYNAANGGPLAQPGDFFTDARAEAFARQRIRYIVARYGASTALMSWELFNEVDLTDGFSEPTVAAWHRRMADYIRSIDPARHLVTTSVSFPFANEELFTDAGLDVAQLHYYARTPLFTLFTDLGRDVIDWTRSRHTNTGLPTLFAEIGVDSRGAVETRAADRDGKGFHDALWAGVVSGGVGTGMSWWWDNLIDQEPQRYYPMFSAVARFVDGVAWDREHFAPSTATASRSDVSVDGLEGDTVALYWLRDTVDTWDARHPRVVHGTTLSLTPADERWCATWYDTWRGTPIATATVHGRLTVPDFRRDLALALRAC